jgi:hypothetical protein
MAVVSQNDSFGFCLADTRQGKISYAGGDNMKHKNSHKIGTKLILAFLAVALLCGVVGIIGILNMNDISQSGLQMYTKNTVGVS